MTAKDKIDRILSIKELRLKDRNDLAMRCGILPNTLSAAVSRNVLSDDIVMTIHDKLGVGLDFLREGKEPVLDRANITRGDIEPAFAGKPLGDDFLGTFRKMVEGDTEYVLIPRDVLKDTKLISTDQLASDRKIMDKLIEQNEKMLTQLLATSEAELPGVKKGKNSP